MSVAGGRSGAALPLSAALGAAAAAIVLTRLAAQLPPSDWLAALLAPAPGDMRQLVAHYASLPRIAVALLCGSSLGLAGALFQQILRNPLASPTTLGVEAGGQLALAVATIAAPGILPAEPVALAGGALAASLVFAVAWARGFSSLSLILAGLVTALFCGAMSAALKLLNQEYVAVLYIWGAGSLAQQDWSVAGALLPRVLVLGGLAALMARPLAILTLDDMAARALGLPVNLVRAGGLAIAVALTAIVIAAIGVIGFLGLAAPQIARLAGARTLSQRLVAAPLVGAFLLVIVDQLVQAVSGFSSTLFPTGAAMALLGAPLLFWLLPRLRLAAAPVAERPRGSARARPLLLLGLAVLGLLVVTLALLVGSGEGGLRIAGPADLSMLAPWRLPRIAVALTAGLMLAVAGTLLQRLTGNPMASPEILGIGTGVLVGIVASLLISAAPGRALQLAAGSIGALAALAVLLSTGLRSRFAAEHLLLTGVALAALLDGVVVAFLALGDPRAGQVLAWISGSTYRADATGVLTAGLAALLLVPAALLTGRWLDILGLGEASARGLGLPLAWARFAIMLIAALLTGSAMLVVGPLTFAGLLGPHLAYGLGFRRAVPQIVAAALIGGIVMVAADWIGRLVIFPLQLPAGLVATLIGGPYLVLQLARRR